jgi:hypothetical protein
MLGRLVGAADAGEVQQLVGRARNLAEAFRVARGGIVFLLHIRPLAGQRTSWRLQRTFLAFNFHRGPD